MVQDLEGRTVDKDVEPDLLTLDDEAVEKAKLRRKAAAPEGDKPQVPTYDGDIDKYKGKTAEEIVKMHQEAEGLIGKHAEQIGKLKDDLAFKERMAEFQTPTPSVADKETEPTGPLADKDPDEFIKVSEVREYIDQKLGTAKTEQTTEQTAKLLSSASAAHNEGKARYLTSDLSKGIEKEVEKVVHDYFRPYVENGQDMSQYLRTKEVWDQAARYVRFQRGEYDMLQGNEVDTSSGPTPFAGEHPTGRTPSQANPDETPVKLDEKGRFIMRKFGLTEEEALEGVRDERKRRREAI